MKTRIPSFIPLCPAKVTHLKALESVRSHEELQREITRYNRKIALYKMEHDADINRPVFDTEAERIAYTEAERLIEIALRDKEVFALDLSDLTALSMLPPRIVGLKNLKSLDIVGTLIVDITPLANLTTLITLDLSDTMVEDIAPLANLSVLSHLYLRSTPVWDIEPLANLPTLSHLNLEDTEVEDVAPLANLPALSHLHLTGTKVKNISLLDHLDAQKSIF